MNPHELFAKLLERLKPTAPQFGEERMNWRDNWSEELAEYMMTHDGFYGRRLRWWEIVAKWFLSGGSLRWR